MATPPYGGQWVVNPSGGLISKGHPLGATGLAQCAELTWQLRGAADKRQVATSPRRCNTISALAERPSSPPTSARSAERCGLVWPQVAAVTTFRLPADHPERGRRSCCNSAAPAGATPAGASSASSPRSLIVCSPGQKGAGCRRPGAGCGVIAAIRRSGASGLVEAWVSREGR